ncbi:hypothetical protein ACPR111641_10750 [Acinetobacter pragensis]
MPLKQRLFYFTAASLMISSISATTPDLTNYASFIPKNWKVLEKTQGDLNRDGQADLVLIAEDTHPENIVKNESLGNPQLNLNPRKLMVLLQSKQGYQLAASNSSLPTEGDADSPCLADPLGESEALKIHNGVLHISLHYWLSCGSWYVTNKTYTFRYQDQAFKLIGYDSNDFHRASGDISEQSINFSTGKIKSTSGQNEFEESAQPPKIQWTELKNKYSLSLEHIQFSEHYEFQ